MCVCVYIYIYIYYVSHRHTYTYPRKRYPKREWTSLVEIRHLFGGMRERVPKTFARMTPHNFVSPFGSRLLLLLIIIVIIMINNNILIRLHILIILTKYNYIN